MRRPLTVVRFTVPKDLSQLPFALREACASFVGVDVAPRQVAEFLSARIGQEVIVSFTSQYGREARQNLDYLSAKLDAADSGYSAARDLYPLPHDEQKIASLIARASYPVNGPSFSDTAPLLMAVA